MGTGAFGGMQAGAVGGMPGMMDGGMPSMATIDSTSIQKVVAEQERLMAAQDFEAADELRRHLSTLGVDLFDNEEANPAADVANNLNVALTGINAMNTIG